MKRPESPGFSITELLIVLAIVAILLAMALPVIASGRRLSGVEVSLSNLVTIGAAHAIYAADHNGRQLTQIDDDMSTYGSSPTAACMNYLAVNGKPHPALILGWGLAGNSYVLFAYRQGEPSFPGNHELLQPVSFGSWRFGSCRLPNTRPLHNYLSGRFYDPVFYPPNDSVVYDVVHSLFDEPGEYVETPPPPAGYVPHWSSYCMSPAAMHHPDVMRHPLDGGWQDPWQIDHGFTSPGLYQATYPNLKTQFIEHHWNQNALPNPCNPAWTGGSYGDCEPYYFNMALASEPAALFYDMSARLLPNTEALASDQLIMQQTGYGLWSRDTPYGEYGYHGELAYDLFELSHHILTTEGIHGRDTLGPGTRGLADASAAPKRRPPNRPPTPLFPFGLGDDEAPCYLP